MKQRINPGLPSYQVTSMDNLLSQYIYPPVVIADVPTTKETVSTKGTTMYYMNETDQVARGKNYLHVRLTNARDTIETAAQKFFGLWNDPPPYNGEQLVERIKSGKFILHTKDELGADYIECPLDYFTWRDPSIKRDDAGYEAWREKDKATRENILDLIELGTADEALKAIKTYEAATIQ